MRERPIIFSTPMVRALLAGTKTQTRRVVRPQPPAGCSYSMNGSGTAACCHTSGPITSTTLWVPPTPRSRDHLLPCPYGVPGDRLWVRETHLIVGGAAARRPRVVYRASNEGPGAWASPVWRPSIFMPRWASRITLELREVRVQRLQEISEEDAKAEGVEALQMDEGSFRPSFEGAWDTLNDKREGCSWADNPWVWCLTFRKVEGEAS